MTPTAPSNFTDFIQFVQNQTNNLPSLIFLLIFFGLLVMLICILIINMSVRKDRKISLNEKKSLLKRNFSLPPLGGIIASFLVKQGWIQVNSISQIFLKGLEFLKKNFGEHALYKLPWYIVLGSKNSGKSTLVNHTQLHEPHSSPDFSLHEPNPPIRWKFFSRGVLIDVAGRLFLNNPEIETDTITWRNLLILLARYRASRPLNGIVLCVSAKDLYGKEKLSPDALQARANTMLHTLSRTQRACACSCLFMLLLHTVMQSQVFKILRKNYQLKIKETYWGGQVHIICNICIHKTGSMRHFSILMKK